MKFWLILGALLGLLAACPALAAIVLGTLGVLLVAAAGQPAVWAFAAGLYAWPRLAARAPRLVRSLP